MKLVPISKLVTKTNQIDPINLAQKTFVYIDISSIDKETKAIATPEIIPIDQAPSRARKEIRSNDVLISTVRPNLNAVAIVPRHYNNQIASTGFCVLRPKNSLLDPNYLFYFSQTEQFILRLSSLSTGAGYPAVSDEIILETEIPFPPLSEQQRIAAILIKVDHLRRMRRYAHQLSDRYIQSVFLEMFGDPVTNPHNWDRRPILSLISDLHGGAPLKPKDLVDNGFPVLHKGAIKTAGEIQLDHKKNIFTNPGFVKEHQNSVIDKTYLAITLRDLVSSGPSIGLISGLENSPHEKYILAQGAYAFHVNKNLINEEYLVWISNNASFRKYLRSKAVGSTQIHIRLPVFTQLEIPTPPINLLGQFESKAKYYKNLLRRQKESTRQTEILFQSLLQRAFRGEL